MNEDLPLYAIDLALKLGAEYSEARLQRTKEITCLLRNGKPEPAIISDSYGLGVRILYSGALSFVATNILSIEKVKNLVEKAVKISKASSLILKERIKINKEKTIEKNWHCEEKEKIENLGIDGYFNYLTDFDSLIKDDDVKINFSNRLLVLSSILEEKVYINSDGSKLKSRVPRIDFQSYITITHDGKPDTVTIPAGYSQLGESGGWEIIKRLKIHEYISDEVKNLSLAVQSTTKPPKDSIDVILGPQLTGIISHESSGHPGESDRILGREAAQAGESYLKDTDLGMKIGSKEACVSDDPTIPNSNGFYLYDDEGVPARKRKLIDRGIINEFLHNRFTASQYNINSNGSSRASRFDREPIIRMANTFVEAGDYSFEELFKDVNLGVYMKSFMEWNIDDKRLNQRYVGLEAYLVKNGEIKGMIKKPVLEITTPMLWNSIDARGKDVEFMAATCGKGDPMQGIPVGTGGPHIRLRGIKLGER